MLPLTTVINLFSMLFVKNHTAALITDSITDYRLIGSTLLFALTPALIEEISYRGVFYQAARGRRPIRAMVVSGLLFGAMHMNFNQILYACVMGVIFGLVIEASGSLLSTMIMHFMFNFNSVFLSWAMNKLMNSEFYKQLMELNGEQNSMAEVVETEITIETFLVVFVFYGFLAAVGLLVGYFVLKGIAKLNGKHEHFIALFSNKKKNMSQETERCLEKEECLNKEEYWNKEKSYNEEEYLDEEEPKTKIWNIWYTLGVLICVAMAVLQEVASRL
jgi:hypothetical protein